MEKVLINLEIFLEYFSRSFIVLLELMGMVILIYGCFNIFYHFIFPKRKDFSTKLRIKLGRFTSLALEFFLAAEILKTIYIRELTELYVIAAIIILRIIMVFVVHWEMGLDLKEMRERVKNRHSKE